MAQDLAVVMPVYNEADCIVEVIDSWRSMLTEQRIDFRMIVLNDGSRDGTADALKAFAGDGRIEIVNKPNSGHGPTILQGYRRAVEIARWVFQVDSDNEMGPEHFPHFWRIREDYDAILGIRGGREQNAPRRVISAASRLAVGMMYGKGVVDVNVPYRLIRADMLKGIIAQIPADTFAPNVVISGALSRSGVRIWNEKVPFRGRTTGTVSIVKWKLWKSAARALWQTIRCRHIATGSH